MTPEEARKLVADPLPDAEFHVLGVHHPAPGARPDVAALTIKAIGGEPWILRARDEHPVARLDRAAFRALAAALLPGREG